MLGQTCGGKVRVAAERRVRGRSVAAFWFISCVRLQPPSDCRCGVQRAAELAVSGSVLRYSEFYRLFLTCMVVHPGTVLGEFRC